MPGQPRPIGAVFQPEVAARGIYFAAHSDRTEVLVGYPTVQSVLGDKIASSYFDEYLAEVGIEGQQADEPVSPSRTDNLFEPVAGDHGAHGRFDSEARASSPGLWASMYKKELGLAALSVAAAAAIGFMLAGRSNDKAKAGQRD